MAAPDGLTQFDLSVPIVKGTSGIVVFNTLKQSHASRTLYSLWTVC